MFPRTSSSSVTPPASHGASGLPETVDGLVDIHSHLLPGIDDGPADLEGAVALVRAAREGGTTTLVATPHLRDDFPNVHVTEIADRCTEVREALVREGVKVQVVVGAEVSLLWALEASYDELQLASFAQQGTD